MTRRLLAAAFAAVLAAACDQRGTTTTDFERMRKQPRYDTYGEGPFFADGRAMQPPPEGTVAFGERSDSTTDAARAAVRIPVPVTRATVERGRDRYRVVCQPCHGVDGTADSAVAHSMQMRRPPSLVDGRVGSLPPGVVFDAIGRGFGLMPSYADALPVNDRWAVVSYVEALRMSHRVSLDTLDPAMRARALRELAARAGSRDWHASGPERMARNGGAGRVR